MIRSSAKYKTKQNTVLFNVWNFTIFRWQTLRQAWNQFPISTILK